MKPTTTLLFVICVLTTYTFGQPCDYKCWNKVYLQSGVLQCGAENVVFEDDFENQIQLDQTKWQTHFFGVGYEYDRTHGPCEEQFFFEDNVTVSNGVCTITGKYEPFTTYTNSQGTTFERHWTSGMIMIRDDLDGYSYGRYEASLKIPGYGWWPAFWLWNHDEVDIFENQRDDTKFLANVYSGKTECSNISTEHTAPLLDGNWHTFAVEWTPFKITFFYNGEILTPPIYRLYDQNGAPLKVNCDNNVIPEGVYYLNPAFLEIRERAFKPIVGLGILPKNNNDCNCPYGTHCSDPWLGPNQWCGDKGHPLNSQCNVIGDVPAILEIDYVRVYETDFTVCSSIVVYGENCLDDGDHLIAIKCTPLCPRNTNDCCPPGLVPEGENCKFNENFEGVQKYVFNNAFYTTTNCHLYSETDCCPPGTQLTGAGCLVNFSFPTSYQGFVENNTFYTTTNCTAHLYVENYSAHSWLNEVEVTNVTSTPNIDVIAYDNYEITYEFLQEGSGSISIYYRDDCGQISQYTVSLSTQTSNPVEDLNVDNINECNNTLNATLSWLTPCNIHNVALDAVAVDIFDASFSANAIYTDGNIQISWNDIYLVKSINLTITYESECYGQISESIEIDIPLCDDCCQEGFAYDGANCYSPFDFSGVEGYVLNGKFYTTRDCLLYPLNNCCPPGTYFDGTDCLYESIDPGFNGFVLNNSFYTNVNCEMNCCPEAEGFNYDGANCYSGFHFNGVEGYVENGMFYTTTNCQLYANNDCCPPGTTNDGIGCLYRNVPPGYSGFIFGNSFYTKTNCETCCPSGSVYDGANCYFGIHFEGVTGFVENGTFYTTRDCDVYTDNDCCPPGSTWDGDNCYFSIHLPPEFQGFVYNNSFYATPKDCYAWSNDAADQMGKMNGMSYSQDSTDQIYTSVEQGDILIYPNPFKDNFTIDVSSVMDQIQEITIFSSLGQIVYESNGRNISPIVKLDHLHGAGIFFVKIRLEDDLIIRRVIKL